MYHDWENKKFNDFSLSSPFGRISSQEKVCSYRD